MDIAFSLSYDSFELQTKECKGLACKLGMLRLSICCLTNPSKQFRCIPFFKLVFTFFQNDVIFVRCEVHVILKCLENVILKIVSTTDIRIGILCTNCLHVLYVLDQVNEMLIIFMSDVYSYRKIK